MPVKEPEVREIEEVREIKVQRPKRATLSPEETLRRMEAIDERKDKIIAAVRQDKN